MDLIKIILEIIALAFTVIGGCWTVYQMMVKKMETMEAKFEDGFKTIFKRMDEKQKSYYEEFVNKELYEAEIRHQEQRNNDKFISVQKVFEAMFSNLEQKLDSGIESLKEMYHNGKK